MGTLEHQVHTLKVRPASGVVCCSSAALNCAGTGTGRWRAGFNRGTRWKKPEEARVYAKNVLND